MNDDAEKIEQLEEMLQTEDSRKSFALISLALSIKDEEERNLHLLATIRWLLHFRQWQLAYGAAQLMADGYEKSEAMQLVAESLVVIGHLEKAFLVFDEAENYSQTENLSAWQQAELLHRIAQSLRRMKAFFKADEIWEKAVVTAHKGEDSLDPQDRLDAASVLAEIAVHFAELGRIDRGLSIAQQINNISKREKALLQISEAAQQIKQVA